jgi:hypothetical protein
MALGAFFRNDREAKAIGLRPRQGYAKKFCMSIFLFNIIMIL